MRKILETEDHVQIAPSSFSSVKSVQSVVYPF
jgi:hypothetical protein